jgi:hypothetical protein
VRAPGRALVLAEIVIQAGWLILIMLAPADLFFDPNRPHRG